MATTKDGSDPWDWDVDRVVQELCTTNRSWQPRSSSMTISDPSSLEQALRQNEVTGSVLLVEMFDDGVLKDDFGLKVLGRRAFVRSAIVAVRLQSAQYLAYQRIHQLENIASSEISRSIHEFMQHFPGHSSVPGVMTSQPQQLLPPTNSEPAMGTGSHSLNSSKPPVEETPASKRRKLDCSNAAEDPEPQFDNSVQDMLVAKEPEQNGTSISTPEAGSGFIELNGKKRKRIAPTLITSAIDPNRHRELPTEADIVLHNALKTIDPGVPFIGDDGRKRLVPILQPDNVHKTPYNFEDGLRKFDNSEHAPSLTSDVSSCELSNVRGQTNPDLSIESIATGYLGKRKMQVDDLFYKGSGVGQELSLVDDAVEFSSVAKKISTGRRLYVHSVMRNFLRAERQVFVRNGKFFSAVRPYPEKLAPKFQRPSFTLYYADRDGQIHARREEVPSWPEIDLNATAWEPQNGSDGNSVTFNPLGPDMVFSSYDSLDPSNLEKYNYLEGGDQILPLYGESDEENEYDLATWREIEDELGELQRPLQSTRKPHLNREEIDEAIDEGIADLVTKWHKRTLPKRQKTAYRVWRKSRLQGTRREQILAVQKNLNHILERIAKMRKEILDDVWTSKQQVRKQTRIMELSIFEREDLTFKISTLEQQIAPKRPPRTPSVAGSKKSISRSDDGEEGESIGSESDEVSSDDDMGDFVIPDETHPTIEEEQHELNLADSEDEDDEDAMMSDASVPDISENPPEKPTRPIRLKSSKKPKFSADQVDSDLEDFEFLSPLSANNTSTPNVKDEELTLPKLPAVYSNDVPEMIDLTMLSSDDSPPGKVVVNLITPRKRKKPLIKLTNRSSPFRSSPISISDLDTDTMPDPANMPSYDNPTAIAKYSFVTWARSFDKERLLIKIFHSMDEAKRTSLFVILSHISEEDLWGSMRQVIDALAAGKRSLRGMDAQTYEIMAGFVRLFGMFIDCRYHPWRENLTEDQLKKVLENQTPWFSSFYRLCSKMEGYFDHTAQPSMPQRSVTDVDDDDDEDGEPISATRRRPRYITTSEEEIPEQETPHKKRKKAIFENAQARTLREQDRIRLAEQEQRRKMLHARMAKSGHAGDERRGLIIINDAATEDQGFVFVHEHIARRIKKHQIDGIRFLWNQIVTSGDEEPMQGCLLAHTMGLGKTMQVITLLVAIAQAASSTDSKISSQVPQCLRVSRTLVLCPPGLINNWMDELLTWVPEDVLGVLGELRKVDASIKLPERLQTIAGWYEDGGVLVVGYEMFRALIENKKPKTREAALSEEQHEQVKEQLLKGPNIIIADEAHKMKNATAAITLAASQFRSKSRIALTGSPLANNVEEYHTMIEWVAPNYLGPVVEFRSKYVEPIQSGLWHDSTSYERRKSLKMLGVLKEDLAPKVHRADMTVLRNDLPPKKEFVITVPLTDLQRKAYSLYVRSMIAGAAYSRTKSGEVTQTTIWHWLAILSLLCNHPDCFNAKLHERKQDARKEIAAVGDLPSSRDGTDLDQTAADLNTSIWKVGVSQDLINEETKLFAEEAPDMKSIDLSYKVKILCQILDASKVAGDKVLVFSQSIPTLNFLEGLFVRQRRDYARLDGKTTMSKRQDMTKAFNRGKTDIYLISTAAGGLGLNLPSANRVVIFDFKFNPIMEEQAIGRAYRIGQLKPTFVYRFVAGGTFEDSVHNKTVFKMQLASRVVDKKNPIAWATKKLGDFLFEPKDVPQKDLSEFAGMDPMVLDKILESQGGVQTIRAIVQSDTFERDDDDKLTAEEEKEVKQLLSDEQLKRSNPQKWLRLQAHRSLQAYNQALRQGLGQQAHPIQMNASVTYSAGNANYGMNRPQQGVPARLVTGQENFIQPPSRPPFDLSANGLLPPSTLSVGLPDTTPQQIPKPAPSPNQAPSPGHNLDPYKSPIAENSPQLSDKVRSPTPDNEKAASGQKTPSEPSPILKSPRDNKSRNEGSSPLRTKKNFTNTLEAILTEAANRPHESTGFETPIQLSDRVTQISVAIRSSLRRLNELAPQEGMRAVVASLKRDSIKCQALLTSQLSPEDFVRGILKSLHSDTSPHQEPSSSSSNGKDDISQTTMFVAMNRQPNRPVKSLRTPVSVLKKGVRDNALFTSPHRLEDERALQKIKEKRQLKKNRIPTWAEDSISRAQSEHQRDSRASLRSAPSRPK